MATQTRHIGLASQHWQSAADMMPQLICLLDGSGRLILSNRTIERWGLGEVARANGTHLHDILHQGCVDPDCYIRLLGLTGTAQLSPRPPAEREVFDPVLQRHFTVLVQYLVRPSRQSRAKAEPNAVVVMSDISDFRRPEAGSRRFHVAPACLACDEMKRHELSEEMQARLFAILEKTADYVAKGDAAGSAVHTRPPGRATLGVTPKGDLSRMEPCADCDQEIEDRIRDGVIPSARRNGVVAGEARRRNHVCRKMDLSEVTIAHLGNSGQVEHLSTIVSDTTAQVEIPQSLGVSHDELRRLSGLLITIQEGERRRIAMDLHDGLGQSLSLIKLSLERATRQLAAGATGQAGESLQQLIPRVREAVAEVRRVSTELRPWILDDLGIVRTLSWFFREFEAAWGDITVEQAIDVAEHEVPVPLQITIYRILQEATNNIVKHAGAKRVRVRLDRVDDVLNLVIEDDGCGFDPDSVQCAECQSRGLGLLSMKERTSFSGGTYQLSSSPGQGTRVQISWPCGQLPDKASRVPQLRRGAPSTACNPPQLHSSPT